jgi:hypothetical protein
MAGQTHVEDDLHRQERLLQQSLAAGLESQQRRVQTALLRQTQAGLALAQRAREAIENGWEPFRPSAAWGCGYVEDPRFLRGRARIVSTSITAPVAAFAGWLLTTRWEALPAALMAAVLFVGLQACLHEVLGRIAEDRDKTRLRYQGDELRIFNAPMPQRAIVAYRRARQSGLFDTFTVHSPRAADFRAIAAAEAPSLGLLDPVLIGHIAADTFLIAQWDLAEDLASL